MREATIRIDGMDYEIRRWIHGRPCCCRDNVARDYRCIVSIARCPVGRYAILNSEHVKKKAVSP